MVVRAESVWHLRFECIVSKRPVVEELAVELEEKLEGKVVI